jgi:hypothetical protein
MNEILTIGKAVLEGGSSVALMGLLVTLAVPSLRKKLWGGNGELKELQGQIENIKENHLHEVKDILNKQVAQHEEQTLLLNKMLYILEDLKTKKRK